MESTISWPISTKKTHTDSTYSSSSLVPQIVLFISMESLLWNTLECCYTDRPHGNAALLRERSQCGTLQGLEWVTTLMRFIRDAHHQRSWSHGFARTITPHLTKQLWPYSIVTILIPEPQPWLQWKPESWFNCRQLPQVTWHLQYFFTAA